MSRGTGSITLHQRMALARDARVRLFAEFRPNDRNRMMHMTLGLAGLKEATGSGADCLLEADLDRRSPAAGHTEVKAMPRDHIPPMPS